jgi:hypothetical protein
MDAVARTIKKLRAEAKRQHKLQRAEVVRRAIIRSREDRGVTVQP